MFENYIILVNNLFRRDEADAPILSKIPVSSEDVQEEVEKTVPVGVVARSMSWAKESQHVMAGVVDDSPPDPSNDVASRNCCFSGRLPFNYFC